MFTAFGPLSELSTSYSTVSPSFIKVPTGIAVLCTNTSFPSSPCMNPYPFLALYHLTVPFISSPPQTLESGLCKRTKTKSLKRV